MKVAQSLFLPLLPQLYDRATTICDLTHLGRFIFPPPPSQAIYHQPQHHVQPRQQPHTLSRAEMAHECCSSTSINEKTHSKLGTLHGVGLELKTHIHVVMLPACICCCLSLKSFGHQSLNLLVSIMERNPCDGNEASPAETSWFPEIQNHWMETQDSLKRRLVTKKDVTWKLPTNTNTAIAVHSKLEEKKHAKKTGTNQIQANKLVRPSIEDEYMD